MYLLYFDTLVLTSCFVIYTSLQPNEEGVHVLSFQLTVPDSRKHTFYCAFCFPHSYTECQKMLAKVDEQFSGAVDQSDENSIYYHRSVVLLPF